MLNIITVTSHALFCIEKSRWTIQLMQTMLDFYIVCPILATGYYSSLLHICYGILQLCNKCVAIKVAAYMLLILGSVVPNGCMGQYSKILFIATSIKKLICLSEICISGTVILHLTQRLAAILTNKWIYISSYIFHNKPFLLTFFI